MKVARTVADILSVQDERQINCREADLALAHVRTTSALYFAQSQLRKISALIGRDTPAGVIVQRIVGSDTQLNETISWILGSMWQLEGGGLDFKTRLSSAIEFFGWDIVREVICFAMLHQVHAELGPKAFASSADLDAFCLGTLTAGAFVGADPFSAMLCNVGVAGLCGIGGLKYAEMRQSLGDAPEQLLDAETAEFGFDHAYLGAAMLMEADISQSIVKNVLRHPDSGTVLWLAEQLSTEAGVGGGLGLAKPDLRAMAVAGSRLGAKKIERILRAVKEASDLPRHVFATVQFSAA